MKLKKFNEDRNTNNFYLCFWIGPDGGDRESYSVYYSKLVEANSEEEALEIYFKSGKAFAYQKDEPTDPSYYGVKKMDIIK
jgi:hypothetical protein